MRRIQVYDFGFLVLRRRPDRSHRPFVEAGGHASNVGDGLDLLATLENEGRWMETFRTVALVETRTFYR